jgi:hypothetical protein
LKPGAKRVVAGFLALVIVIVFLIVLATLNHEEEQAPIEQQIAQSLAGAQQAIARGDLEAVARLVSTNYKDNYGNSESVLKSQLRKSRGDLAGWTVTYSNVVITLDKATGLMSAELDVAAINQNDPENLRWAGHVGLSFQQEGRNWLIINSSGWQGDVVL